MILGTNFLAAEYLSFGRLLSSRCSKRVGYAVINRLHLIASTLDDMVKKHCHEQFRFFLLPTP